MTLEPVHAPDRPVEQSRDPSSGLPLIDRAVAQRHGLVSIYDLSRKYGVPTRNFKTGLAREGAPAPKAMSVEYHYGRRSELFSLIEFQSWHDRLSGEKPLGVPRRSHKVRLVGTKTPTAGGRYVWRDPRRWNPER